MAGIDCTTSSGSTGGGVTWLNNRDSCEQDGTLTSWCVQMASSGQAKLKVFRYVTSGYPSPTFVFIGESGLINVASGVNSNLPCSITVLNGDKIALYSTSSPSAVGYTSQVGYSYSGDMSSSVAVGSWTAVKSVPTLSASFGAVCSSPSVGLSIPT